MANHRSGTAKGYAGQKGGAHTKAWRDDPHILDRMVKVADLRFAKGKHVHEVAAELGISVDTVYDDTNRFYEWTAEASETAKAKSLTRLEYIIRGLFERIAETDARNQNKGAYYGHLLRAIEMLGKLDGLYREKVEVTGKDGGPLELADATRERLAGRIAELAARGAAEPTPSKPD